MAVVMNEAITPPTEPLNTNSAHADRRLQAVFEIARILASEHELKTMISRLLTSLVDTVPPADAGLLLLYNPRTDRLDVTAAHGFDLAALQGLQLAPGESMSGQAFLSGQAMVYATPEETAAAMANMTPANQAIFRSAVVDVSHPQSAVCIPLITNDVRVGVLLLENLRRSGAFAPADLAFLTSIGDLVALAIENARLREELESVRSRAEANRLKAEVVSTLAHELRTPLTSIKGYSTALLMEETAFSPETQREFLKIIDEECNVLQDLIHDLLESSMIDAGFLRLEIQPVRLPRLAREVVADFLHVQGTHRIVVDFPPDFPLVEADPHRITQVLRNLIDNAVKYSPDGGLVVVRGKVEGQEAVISVADQGVGIAPEHLNRLFEKFFRIKSGLGRHVVGTGLGLPIARAIVEGHGGRIWAESQVNQGTTLYFTIPLGTPAGAADDAGEPGSD